MKVTVRMVGGDERTITLEPGTTVQSAVRSLGIPGGVYRVNGQVAADHETLRDGDCVEVTTQAMKML